MEREELRKEKKELLQVVVVPDVMDLFNLAQVWMAATLRTRPLSPPTPTRHNTTAILLLPVLYNLAHAMSDIMVNLSRPFSLWSSLLSCSQCPTSTPAGQLPPLQLL